MMQPLPVLITGGSSGIGRAIAEEFARRGHDLLLVARNRDRLEATQRSIRETTRVAVESLVLDLADPSSGAALAEHIARRRTAIGCVVNGAGAFLSGPLGQASVADIDHLLRTNVLGLYGVTRAVLPGMLARGTGRILNIGSLAGFGPTPSFAAYGASKAFVHAATLALREELRGTGVTVSLLAPGPVRTDFVTRSDGSAVTDLVYQLASDPRTIALGAYRGLMSGEAIIVPGLSARLLWYGLRLAPVAVSTRIMGVVSRAATRGVAQHADC